jgi:hypothetical protein
MTFNSLNLRLACLVLAGGLLAIPGCGGGGAGGVGTGGTGSAGLTQGTVNGFGSIIIDSQRYDDSQVASMVETAPGVLQQTQAQLGRTVELQYTAGGIATRLQVLPALDGPVASVDLPGSFGLLGQTVRVNTDPAAGPVTQFAGGYTGALSVAVGDAVEVHGLVVGQSGVAVILATRIEHLAAAPAYFRVTGPVEAPVGGSFGIGTLQVDASQASVLPQGAQLASGSVVTVLAAASSLSGSALSPQLVAAEVAVQQAGAPGAVLGLSGSVAQLDAATGQFELGGVQVTYAGGAVLPVGASLSNGLYVRVSGVVQADGQGNGSVRASTVTVVDQDGDAEAELKGNIVGYIAGTQSFQVRGVNVDASQALLDHCESGLSEGQYVSVEGSLDATGVVATTVHCKDEPDGGTVERSGAATAVDLAQADFTLTLENGSTLAVHWTPITYFSGVAPATLQGQQVEVQGTITNGVMAAQSVAKDD